jgi:hypothetical protein
MTIVAPESLSAYSNSSALNRKLVRTTMAPIRVTAM